MENRKGSNLPGRCDDESARCKVEGKKSCIDWENFPVKTLLGTAA